jgi:hypothetical protein
MTPDELLTLIEKEEDLNHHWVPQAAIKGPHSHIIDIPLPALSTWWEEQGFPPQDRMNKTAGEVPGLGDLIPRIETYYEDDRRLYEHAKEVYSSL